jgi:hypothetical protein
MLSASTKNKKSSFEDFLTTKEASEIIPYSREYIGRLAREKKVRSALVGGKWIVSLASLQDFYEQAKIEEEVLAQRVRGERLADQNVADFIFETKVASTAKHLPSQNIFAHVISISVVGMVGFLFFFLPGIFGSTSNVAQLFNFNQPEPTKSVVTFEMVEMTTPIDIENGILLFGGQEEVVSFDPTTIFSDAVEVVEGEDGVKYLRVTDGEGFSDVPFVNLPSSYQSYQEVVATENVPTDF